METVKIIDVTPRDGLQDASGYVPVSEKIALIEGLLKAGVRSVEVTAFVRPDWIPLLADADPLVDQLRHLDGEWIALVPNERGLKRAISAGIPAVTLVASASESHNKSNLNRSRVDTLAALARVTELAHQAGMQVKGAISTSFSCPFEGEIPTKDVLMVAEAYLRMGVDAIGIADTMGTANPAAVKERVKELNTVRGKVPLSLHLHDRFGWGLANVAMAYEYGVREYEVALAGLGGCPYAPGAAGNLDTEKLVEFFIAQKIFIPIDLNLLAATRVRLLSVLSRKLAAPVMDEN
ncbi:hydroxymethylglutaryl-CoA lyase [Alicyclobacillaceae bacterium I2511]|nr:hydroxymethylglutaryl-CoA lyase [Alicyclobacillaceae bacterium I2511]